MSEAVVDDIVAVLPPLLQSLEALSFVARPPGPTTLPSSVPEQPDAIVCDAVPVRSRFSEPRIDSGRQSLGLSEGSDCS